MSERNPYNPGAAEGEMKQRTAVAFVLMALVLIGSSYIVKQFAPQQPAKPAKKVETGTLPVNPATPIPSSENAGTMTPSGNLTAHSEQLFPVDTDFYHIVFSNRGGVVKSWTLKKYLNAAGKPLELVNDKAAEVNDRAGSKIWYPFSYYFRNNAPKVKLDETALFVGAQSPDGLAVTFDYSSGGVTAHKRFQFQRDSYLTSVLSTVMNNGVPVPHQLAWRGGFGDYSVQSASGIEHSIRYDVNNSKLQDDGTKAAKDGPAQRDGNFSFVGLEDSYFAEVAIPEGSGDIDITFFADSVPTPFDNGDQNFIGDAVGGKGTNQFELFVGPKDINLLRAVNPKLEQIVDFGYMWFVAKPLFFALRFLDHTYIRNYGWSIVVATIFINFLLFPLRLFNMKSMKKMQALQPKIAAINKRYEGVSMRDPKMAMKNEETMALYKENGANPMAGCLPMLIQMPFLIAFYKVLAVSIEMRGANWMWVTDLSQPEHLAIRVLPVVMIISSFLQQRMTPTTGMDPQQQKMMMFMPLVMGFFFYNQSSGLVLYWLTGNLMGIAQQYFFNKTIAPATVQVPVKQVAGNTSVKAPSKNQGRK
jgi:YidC/Oxa1 family membrane protein insertase